MADILHTPLTIVHVIACIFLILVILLQPGKSGGLGIFGSAGAQQVFGGRGAGNFITKTTWTTATIFFLTSIGLAYLSSSTDEALQKRASMGQSTSKKSHAPAPSPASKKQ